MPRLSNDRKDIDKTYFPVMVCPKCGYETTSTNICRGCPETPADRIMTCPVYCYKHRTYHSRVEGDKTVWLGHQGVKMVYSGKVSRFDQKTNRRKTRKYKPKDGDEENKLWIGWGVIFDG